MRDAGSGMGMLSVRYFESTHLIAMFPCLNHSKPPHYLQHQDHTSKPEVLHPAWFDLDELSILNSFSAFRHTLHLGHI